nr:MAG TPA: hypothetical protein [Caudoviricetes sp.]
MNVETIRSEASYKDKMYAHRLEKARHLRL